MKEDGRKKPYMLEPQMSSLISDFACNVSYVSHARSRHIPMTYSCFKSRYDRLRYILPNLAFTGQPNI
jgi:hypothetical protein